jgi:hypothetical protein
MSWIEELRLAMAEGRDGTNQDLATFLILEEWERRSQP